MIPVTIDKLIREVGVVISNNDLRLTDKQKY